MIIAALNPKNTNSMGLAEHAMNTCSQSPLQPERNIILGLNPIKNCDMAE
jgi:hypothetical protein